MCSVQVAHNGMLQAESEEFGYDNSAFMGYAIPEPIETGIEVGWSAYEVYEHSCGLLDMLGAGMSGQPEIVQLHATLDDVGSCGKDGISAVAGYVAYSSDWKKFSWRWMMSLGQLNRSYLHTSKYLNEFPLVGRNGPLDDEDICVILAPFIETVKDALLGNGGVPICVITECDAYDKLTREQKKFVRPPEEHSFEIALSLAASCLKSEMNISDRIAVQMDESANAPKLYSRYEAMKRECSVMKSHLTALCFCDDQGHPPVQAADMLANVVLKTWRDIVSGGNGSRAFRELTTTQGIPRMRLSYYDAARLSAFADKRMTGKGRMDLQEN